MTSAMTSLVQGSEDTGPTQRQNGRRATTFPHPFHHHIEGIIAKADGAAVAVDPARTVEEC